MTSPTISVALCTHNGARFIDAQIESILNQTVPVTQLVISDDASTDNTVELALEVVEQARQNGSRAAPTLIVIRNAVALGVTANFEQAIRAATGEFVVLSDQDDRWRSNRVERALEVFKARPEISLVHSDARLVDGTGAPTGPTLFDVLGVSDATVSTIHAGDALSLLVRRNIVTGATTMFRRSLAGESLPFPAAWVHDEWLAIVAAIGRGVDVVAEPLIDYRQHGANEIGAERLSLGGKIRRMVEPGSARNARLVERARELEIRFGDSQSADIRRIVSQKLEHELVRSALSRKRLARVRPVLRELSTRRYSRFGRGPADAIRDLLQPL